MNPRATRQFLTLSLGSHKEGTCLTAEFTRNGWPISIFAFVHEGTWKAYLNRCPHLPLTLDIGTGSFFTKDGNELLCANHGARFDRGTGDCTWGPCKGRSLQPLECHLGPNNDQLLVDVDDIDRDRPARSELT